jgi:hypothetical protein
MVNKDFMVKRDELKYSLKGTHGSYQITKYVFGDIVDVKTRAVRRGWKLVGIDGGSSVAYHPTIAQCLRTMQKDLGYEMELGATAQNILDIEKEVLGLTQQVVEMEKARLAESQVKGKERVIGAHGVKSVEGKKKASKAWKNEDAAPPQAVEV